VTGLLTGVVVVETGVLMAVDHLGRLLGDEGADVVKVEAPPIGDYLRNIMIRFAPDWSTFHLALNRNKRSITCDARTEEGREVLRRLLTRADVFITGNVGDTNRKLGLDYESVAAVRPSIVYCQVTGFGASGPYAEIPTHGQMMDALGGAAAPMARDDHGHVEATAAGPANSGGVVLGPLYAAFGIACALSRARSAGEGAFLDVSCADAVLASRWLDALRVFNPDLVDTTWSGKGPGASAKYQHYETADGRFVLFCAIEAKFWEHWCRAVGRDDLLASHRDDLVVDFAGGDEALRREIQSVFLTRTLAEWVQLAADADIALGPALQLDEVADDPHLRARGLVVTEQHPIFGEVLTLGNPVVVPGMEFVPRSAPALGEHTDEVLAELGYDVDARAALREAGVT
jgi:crotonobetainyl-CoA:carnitine CoA-transferase CaiB-like acyl-CoA transferase